jgi:ribonuclease HI
MAQKYYVVWAGRRTGVFTDWVSTQQSVDKFTGARFKAFQTRDEAEQAYRAGSNSPAYPRRTPGNAVKKKSSPAVTTTDADEFDVKIYCDGACEPNPGNAGSGIAVYRDGKLAELWYGLYNPEGTNNTAELQALYHALRIAQQEIEADRTVQVLSDSQYSINCIQTWAVGWEKKGWKKAGGEIKNLEIIQTTYALYKEIEDEVKLTHIAAHVGFEGNELADRMAMLASQTKQQELKLYNGEIDVAELLKMRAG